MFRRHQQVSRTPVLALRALFLTVLVSSCHRGEVERLDREVPEPFERLHGELAAFKAAHIAFSWDEPMVHDGRYRVLLQARSDRKLVIDTYNGVALRYSWYGNTAWIDNREEVPRYVEAFFQYPSNGRTIDDVLTALWEELDSNLENSEWRAASPADFGIEGSWSFADWAELVFPFSLCEGCHLLLGISKETGLLSGMYLVHPRGHRRFQVQEAYWNASVPPLDLDMNCPSTRPPTPCALREDGC